MNQYRVYTDLISTFRAGVRDGFFVIDMALTATGFSGLEDIDWRNLNRYN